MGVTSEKKKNSIYKSAGKGDTFMDIIYLLLYVAFNSQGHIAPGSLQVEETSAYCTVNHWASASNYQLSNMKSPARDLNRQPQRLEARTLTATPPSPPFMDINKLAYQRLVRLRNFSGAMLNVPSGMLTTIPKQVRASQGGFFGRVHWEAQSVQ